MATFTVTWVIQFEADNAREAAQKALDIQRDPFSSAVVFETHNWDTDVQEEIDLLEDAEDEVQS